VLLLLLLQHAKELMAASETRGGYTFIFEDFFKKIYRGLEEAEKDNNFIYHAKIPELSSMPALGKAAIAKSTAFNGAPFSMSTPGEFILQ
jgi:programmed cell death 6-interacting protein